MEEVLSPWASYKFRVQSVNHLGEGEFSMPSPVVNTRRDVPFISPRNIGGGGGKTGDLTITWDVSKIQFNLFLILMLINFEILKLQVCMVKGNKSYLYCSKVTMHCNYSFLELINKIQERFIYRVYCSV